MMKLKIGWAASCFAALLVLASPGMASGQTSSNKTPSVTLPPKDASNYLIGAQDVLDVNVWKETELTKTVPVRPDGKISLPLLNDVQAAGLTPTQLSQSITEKLKKYIAEPQVTVIVTVMNSQRVYLIGQVARPGAYPLLPGMTMLQAISSAGGLAQFASSKKIFLTRTEDGKSKKYPFNYKDVMEGRAPDQDLPLKAGDTIVVP
jgi:polysaccharide export outer membrane protein